MERMLFEVNNLPLCYIILSYLGGEFPMELTISEDRYRAHCLIILSKRMVSTMWNSCYLSSIICSRATLFYLTWVTISEGRIFTQCLIILSNVDGEFLM